MSSDEQKSDWLYGLPQNWQALPLGYRCSVQLGKMLDAKKHSGKFNAPYLRNVDVQWGRINVNDLPEMDFDEQDRLRFSLRPGDILVCEGGEIGRAAVWCGALKECYYQKALHRVRRLSDRDNEQFLFYCFQAAAREGAFTGGTGITTIEHLPAERLKKVRFPFPPIHVQNLIASLLNRETARVDALIDKKRRLLELLDEKRLAAITHAVTKGLNLNTRMKDSGVEWIGETPLDWNVARVRHVAKLKSGHTPSRNVPEYWQDCTIPWFTLNDVWQLRAGKKYVSETAEQISKLGLANSSARLLPAETVILSRTASIGFAGILGLPMATTQDFVNWICGARIRPQYLYYVFLGMKNELRRVMRGSTHQTIYMPVVQQFTTPLPPVNEQDEIVAHLDSEVERVDQLLDKNRRFISLLEEKRSALITAAVTGRIDMRDAAQKEVAA